MTSGTVAALDLDHLAAQTFADRELETEILGLFLDQCERLWPVLASDAPAPRRRDAAHTLKGASLAVGAVGVAQAAEALEARLRAEGDPAERLAALDDAIRLARAAVARRLAGQGLAKPPRLP